MSGPGTFRRLDFASLWRGREKVTAVESAVITRALEGRRRERLLEIGVGSGRTARVARRLARAYVGVDLVREFVGSTRSSSQAPVPDLAVADVRRLPFRRATFDTVLMVRVYNFFRDPLGLLAELRRVLVPGGDLLLTCHTHPSLASLVDDLKMGLRRRGGDTFRPMTFSADEVVEVRPSLFPAFSPTPGRLASDLARAGFTVVGEWGAGYEDLAPSAWLPESVYVRLAGWPPVVRTAPVRFVLARTGGPAGKDGGPRRL